MIILINGAFGSGKTSTAKALVSQIPNSMIFDPEEVGFFLRSILKDVDPQPDDFQHYPLWRTLVVEMAKHIQDQYKLNLIMPMTIWRETYFKEIVGGLAGITTEFHHFCLTANEEVIRERLLGRGEVPGSWAEQQAIYCVEAFKSPVFETHIDTSTKSIVEVVEQIMSQLKVIVSDLHEP
jgi:chloramphenicol 3-O-phosphotransferase